MEYARYWSSGRLARFPFYLPACLMAQWVHPIRIPSFLASRSLRLQPVCCNKPKLQYHVNPSRQKELNPQTCWVAYLDQGTDLAVKALVALACGQAHPGNHPNTHDTENLQYRNPDTKTFLEGYDVFSYFRAA
jgi:hypothetical protein